MRNFTKHIFSVLLVLILVSCSRTTVYDNEVKFMESGWNRFRPETFEFEIKNADKRYDIQLEIKLTESFQHMSLPMFYFIDDNSGAENRSGRFSIRIKDLQNVFLNQADKNGIYTYQQTFQAKKKFNEPGKYKYTLEHGTSNFDLKGIVSLRFFVTLAKK
jgi:gliding motility-associated lipoprotein GldH